MNIVEAIKGDVNNELLSALAAANNETLDKTNITINTSTVSLLLAFMKRASTESGLNLLHNLSNSGNFSIHNPSDSIFPGDKINKLSDEGNALISKIIPDKKSPLITFVSSFSGVRNTTANRTNGLVTLMILNKLKQITASKSLDLAGLAELFADQKDFIVDSAPKNLIEKLSQHIGLGNLISLGSSIITTSATLNTKNEREKQKSTESQSNYTQNEVNENSSNKLKNWLIPGIFGLLLLGFAGYYFYNQNISESDSSQITADTLVNINDTIKIDSVKSPLSDSTKAINVTSDTLVVEMEETNLPNGQKITLEKENLDGKMFAFLNDTTKTRAKVLVSSIPSFNGTNGSISTESSTLFANIGSIMKAYPQSRLKITVNEYAENDSTRNQTSSNKKAFSIKRILLNSGIQSFRIDAVGSLKPGQSTEALKAKEVELLVMKK